MVIVLTVKPFLVATMHPEISIIMPCFNAEKFIESSIKSVLNQSFLNWELIVVDDKSSDSSAALINSLAKKDKRIIPVFLEVNHGGPGFPRNIGIGVARGKYTAFLDADDIWHQQKLELQMTFLEKYDVGMISSEKSSFSDQIPPSIPLKYSELSVRKIVHRQLLLKNFITNSSVMLKSELLKKKKFNEGIDYVAVEDYLLWLELHRDCFSFSLQIESALCFYRLNALGISQSKVKMLKKVSCLLGEYRVNNKRLGLIKYFYLSTYAFFSFWKLLTRAK